MKLPQQLIVGLLSDVQETYYNKNNIKFNKKNLSINCLFYYNFFLFKFIFNYIKLY